MILRAAALALVCLGLLCGRVIYSSSVLLGAGEAALSAGKREQAVRDLGRAARLYTPGNPYAQRARAGLRTLAKEAEGRGDRQLAILSFRELRSAILATRSVYTPERVLLALANEHLAVLLAAEEASDAALSHEPLSARQAWHRQALGRDEMPRTGFALLALFGAVLLIGGGLGIAERAVDKEGRLRGKPALRFGLLALLGLLLLSLGLYLA